MNRSIINSVPVKVFSIFMMITVNQILSLNAQLNLKIDDAISISVGENKLLQYQYKISQPPAGINPVYQRSGFIHPIYTLNGQILTRIQPPDHYHHYGIWNPWTQTVFEKDTVDFWNLIKKEGTVRHKKIVKSKQSKNKVEFTVLHEHVVFKKDGSEKVALNEFQTYKITQPEINDNYYIIDFVSSMKCASSSPLKIIAYRYAGFGWRATEYWDKDNSEMLTSEGNTRDNTDNTKARWIKVYGKLPDNENGGIVMMSHPQNYNHPEPLRIWDKSANGGRGDVFANFAPTKDKDWELLPKKTYKLKYRLIVFNGDFSKEKANEQWDKFAQSK
jgi:hypothetical protein